MSRVTEKIKAAGRWIWRDVVKYLSAYRISCAVGATLFLGVLSILYALNYASTFRLDQYMDVICSTTAALAITMFGLTAASYAFVCNELRTEGQQRPHLERILGPYRDELWILFWYSLVFSVETALMSLACLSSAQKISAPDLYLLSQQGNDMLASYENSRFMTLSGLTAFTLLCTLVAIIVMAALNYMIFRREDRYSKIATKLLQQSIAPYKVPSHLKDKWSGQTQATQKEYEKIHNLERLVERVLKNHECITETVDPEHRTEGMLTVVLSQKLVMSFRAGESGGDDSPPEIPQEMHWRAITSKGKQLSHWNKCHKFACDDYGRLNRQREKKGERRRSGQPGPRERHDPSAFPLDYSFTQVYQDLLCYRDSKLICNPPSSTGLGYSGHHLRCSVKRRLLLFLLREESLNNMDLSRISFSGADLCHANLCDSNLMHARLKGANCEGVDFSRSKLPGLYFSDVAGCVGQIPITCLDDNEETWDPYHGREATCLYGATFSHADVSRAFLAAQGEPWAGDFPSGERCDRGVPSHKLYSLEDTSFDYAKLYSSWFCNLSFDQASLEKAQIFDSIFFQCSALSSNFSGAVLTHSLLCWCDFYGANFERTIMAQALIFRANFEKARLQNANFTDANLMSCNFYGAYCQNASFRNIIQDYSAVTKAWEKLAEQFSHAAPPAQHTDQRIDFRYATISEADFSGADLSHARFTCAIGGGSIFTEATGIDICMDNALLTNSIFNHTEFTGGDFRHTIFRNSVFIGAIFDDCQFDETDFSHSLFSQSQFKFKGKAKEIRKANFSRSEGLRASFFQNVILIQCDFRGTGLQKLDFNALEISIKDCKFDTQGVGPYQHHRREKKRARIFRR